MAHHVFIPRRSLSIAATLLSFSNIFSPDIFAQPKNLNFEHFSIDVTSPGWVPSIYQDSRGYLWFGTVDGVQRYDGHTFTSFGHQSGDSSVAAWVQTMFMDRAGNIWLGTSHGLDKVDSVTGRLRHYTPNLSHTADAWSNWIYAIHEQRDGTLWVGTGGGLHLFNPTTESFTGFFHDSTDPVSIRSNKVNAIHEDRAGSIWIGTGAGLERLDRATGEFIHYWPDSNTRENDVSNSMHWVSSLYEDHSGILWLGTNGGLVAFDQKAGRFTYYVHDPKNPWSISDNRVSSVCGDESGTVWVGTGSGGLNVFDRRSQQFTHYMHDGHDPGSLSDNSIAFVFRERSGTLWVGTNGGGVNKLNGTKPLFTRYTHEDKKPESLQSDKIASVSEGTRGTVLVVTAMGLERFDPASETFTHLLHDESVQAVVEDRKGNLCVGTWNGLYKRDGHGRLIGLRDSTGQEFHQNVTCISAGRDRKSWIGTWGGDLFSLDAITTIVSPVRESNSVMTNTVFQDAHGLVWAGMWDCGLICYDPSNGSITPYQSEWGKAAVLSSNHILSIYEDRSGTLWFGANNGLNRYRRTTDSFDQLIGRDWPRGITSILEDDHGSLWMSTSQGISKYDPGTMRICNYDVPGEVGNGCRARNGEMYFGGSGGLIRFHPDSIRGNSYVPPIVISSFQKFERPYPFGKEIRLPHTENSVSFEFAALSYVHPEKNQYAYKMEGVDKDWVHSGTRWYASYPRLEPGEYVFRVRGANNEGVWNEVGTSIAVIITPPWWNRWWFTTLFWVAVVGLIGGTVRYVEMRKLKMKIQQLEREQAIVQERDRTRDRIASDLHDDVASTLGSVALYLESLNRGLRRTSKPTRELMERIGALLNEAQDAVGDIVWSVTPRHDSLENLLWRMKDLATDLCSANEIACSVDAPQSLDAIRLPETLRKSVYLIFKEALNNIVKHAQAKSVSIHFKVVNGMFEMAIQDYGVGFITDEMACASRTEEQSARGHGLRNMTSRAEEMGGRLSILSTPGQGTTVRLSVSMT